MMMSMMKRWKKKRKKKDRIKTIPEKSKKKM